MPMHNDTYITTHHPVSQNCQTSQNDSDFRVFNTVEEARVFKAQHLARINAQLKRYGIDPIEL